MARLTNYQKLLYHCLEDILELYNREKDKKGSISIKEDRIIQRLLGRISAYYDCDTTLSYSPYIKNLVAQDSSIISDRGMRKFSNVMETLENVIQKRQFHHFQTVAVSDTIDTYFELGMLKFVNPPAQPISVNDPQLKKISHLALRHMPNLVANEKKRWLAFSRGRIRVEPGTEFGKSLGDAMPGNHEDWIFPKITTRPWRSFIELAGAVLVNFHVAFGDYSRIRICKQCGNLMIQKRENPKKPKLFCSAKCRSNFNHAAESPDRRRCRERQNSRIQYIYDNKVGNSRFDPEVRKKGSKNCRPKAYLARKDDCKSCSLFSKHLKGGDCPVLREKNPRIENIIKARRVSLSKNKPH